MTVDSAGAQANGSDDGVWQLSADSCDALLVSNASNLVAGDTNGAYDDFVRQCETARSSGSRSRPAGASSQPTPSSRR